MKKKKTARERRAEERQILAQMNEAMEGQETKTSAEKPKKQPKKEQRKYDSSMPEKVHCKRCRTLMENGVCPACGFKIYVPMDEEKRKKIKLVVTVVAIAVFIALFVALQFKNA